MRFLVILTLLELLAVSGGMSVKGDIPADLKPAEYFLGSWRCEESTARGTHTLIWNNTLELNDHWIHMHGEGPPHRPGAEPVITEIYVGYNPIYKRFAMVTINNYGGYWLSDSKGWNGNRWIWIDTTTEDNIWGVTEILKVSTTRYRVIIRTHKRHEPISIAARIDCKKVGS